MSILVFFHCYIPLCNINAKEKSDFLNKLVTTITPEFFFPGKDSKFVYLLSSQLLALICRLMHVKDIVSLQSRILTVTSPFCVCVWLVKELSHFLNCSVFAREYLTLSRGSML